MVLASKRFTYYPFVTLAIVGVASFLFGRVSVGIGRTKCTPTSIDQARDPLLLSTTEGSTSIISAPGDFLRPDKSDWDRLARESRLLESKPPLPVGDGGSPSYIVQPYQVRISMAFAACGVWPRVCAAVRRSTSSTPPCFSHQRVTPALVHCHVVCTFPYKTIFILYMLFIYISQEL